MNVAVIQAGLLESFQVFDTHAAGGEPHSMGKKVVPSFMGLENKQSPTGGLVWGTSQRPCRHRSDPTGKIDSGEQMD